MIWIIITSHNIIHAGIQTLQIFLIRYTQKEMHLMPHTFKKKCQLFFTYYTLIAMIFYIFEDLRKKAPDSDFGIQDVFTQEISV